ncbi:MAG: DEAD/DEAH box helicase [Elusimicrobiaceae bacterium]|nr:DEAD/DEAH box helicase [Elusimicrobiaceae bacterium]
MNVFTQLPEFLQTALTRQGITEPTPVQTRAVPPALQGRDVLATAQTGTGKTLAFLLPLVARLTENPSENALILSPTRELAQQTYEELEKLTDEEHPLTAALIIGGDNIHKQFAALRKHPRVIIATPGRVIDHMGRKSIDLKNTHYLVLDETDRMLDMGFISDMRKIAAVLPPRQTLLFSATLPNEITALANEFLKDPVRVQIGSVVSPADLVLQEIVYVDVREKLPQLLHELNTRQGSILIFTRTKHGAERLAKQLKLYGQKANALHGDLRQNRRRQVLEFFKNQTVRILVATDVAARGIDVPHIAHVINYDLPQCPEDYIHRIGRTGRAGAVGSAISLISDDGQKWKDICKAAKFTAPVKTVQKTIEPLPEPKFVAQEEGSAHAKSRRKERAKREVRPSKATQIAKELLAEGKVYLPQREDLRLPLAQSAKHGENTAEKSAEKHGENAVQNADKREAKSACDTAEKRAPKKVNTFRKAAAAARVLETPEETADKNPFRTVRVGASKKALKRLEQPRPEAAKKRAKPAFGKFYKKRKHR